MELLALCLHLQTFKQQREGEREPKEQAINFYKVTRIGNQPAPYRGLPGPLGPKCRKSLENVSRGLRPLDPKKSQESIGDSPASLRRVSGKCLESVLGVFRDFRGDFLGCRGQRPRETFSRLFRHFGPRGPGRPL